MSDSRTQEAIDKAKNLDNIRIAIETIRNLERYKNYTSHNYEHEEIAATYYPMYKDLHAVEQVLLNKYREDLKYIYWTMYRYITNTIQKALFEEIVDLRILHNTIQKCYIMNVESTKSLYDDIDYIKNGNRILYAFGQMIDWISVREYDPTYEREAYWAGFLNAKNS
jgi:hypothetical protein